MKKNKKHMVKDINDKNLVDAENKFQSVMNDKSSRCTCTSKRASV